LHSPMANSSTAHIRLTNAIGSVRSWIMESMADSTIALVTGTGRPEGIGAAIALALAKQGNDVAFTWWHPYDERVHGVRDVSFAPGLVSQIHELGRRCAAIEADLGDPEAPNDVFDQVCDQIGAPRFLVLSHCESVDSNIFDTTIDSFDRHFAVNARGSWLMIREFAKRFPGPFGTGRIVSLTSDHTAGNLPYGASKGALDRITVAAAREFATLGITSNAINPGPTDTGWMTDRDKARFASATPLGRLGTPEDCARLVAFLCSEEGAWINGQLIESNGGIHA
jgi:3-oxoacyl-[acyl-carrier protein] reductase